MDVDESPGGTESSKCFIVSLFIRTFFEDDYEKDIYNIIFFLFFVLLYILYIYISMAA